MKGKSRPKKLAFVVLLISLGAVLYSSALAFFAYTGTYYLASDEAIALSRRQDASGNILFAPKSTPVAGLIFYPGAKVDERAYAPLSAKLAEQGVYVIIAKMPFHLAVFKTDAATTIKAEQPTISSWYLCGHSLGGAMAASYLAEHVTEYSGLILLASYSTKDLHSTSLKTCTIYGSEDQVLNQNKYKSRIRQGESSREQSRDRNRGEMAGETMDNSGTTASKKAMEPPRFRGGRTAKSNRPSHRFALPVSDHRLSLVNCRFPLFLILHYHLRKTLLTFRNWYPFLV
jgi:hypothetical protein